MVKTIKYLTASSISPADKNAADVVFMSRNIYNGFSNLSLDAKPEVLPDIWNSPNDLLVANIYLEKVYNRLIEKTCAALNKIHGTDFPDSFWEMPTASWLLHYLHALYDRYSRLEYAIKLYGKDNTVFIGRAYNFTPPSTLYEFLDKTSINEDSVSAFYAKIARAMQIKTVDSSNNESDSFASRSNHQGFLKKFFTRIIAAVIVNFPGKKNLLMDKYAFNFCDFASFFNKLNAFPAILDYKNVVSGNGAFNRGVLTSIPADDDFESIAVQLMPAFMPRFLIEEAPFYIRKAKKLSNSKAYFISTGWDNNIMLCFASAMGRLKGAKIIACQHGGGYGQYKKSSMEFLERRHSDFFITWGWTDSSYPNAKLVPLPQPQLTRILNTHRTGGSKAIWMTVSMPKNIYRFYSFDFPDNFQLFLKDKLDFVSNLNGNIRKEFIYRQYPHKYGWEDAENKIFERFPEIQVEHNGNSVKLLKNAKLFIGDYQSTGFMEALAVNVPTILFWNFRFGDERESAVPVFKLLREAGILFDDPIAASKKVNSIWDNVQDWWQDPIRQNARLEFIKVYCRTDPYWKKIWVDTLKQIIQTHE